VTNNPSHATQKREIVQEVLLARRQATEDHTDPLVNAVAENSKSEAAPRCGSTQSGQGCEQRSGKQIANRSGGGSSDECWNSDQVGHFHTDCPRATAG
jgi:hypothetical protein